MIRRLNIDLAETIYAVFCFACIGFMIGVAI